MIFHLYFQSRSQRNIVQQCTRRRVKEEQEEEGQEKGFEKEKEEKGEEVEAKGLKDLNPISVEYWQVPDVSSTRRNFLLCLKFVFL